MVEVFRLLVLFSSTNPQGGGPPASRCYVSKGPSVDPLVGYFFSRGSGGGRGECGLSGVGPEASQVRRHVFHGMARQRGRGETANRSGSGTRRDRTWKLAQRGRREHKAQICWMRCLNIETITTAHTSSCCPGFTANKYRCRACGPHRMHADKSAQDFVL